MTKVGTFNSGRVVHLIGNNVYDPTDDRFTYLNIAACGAVYWSNVPNQWELPVYKAKSEITCKNCIKTKMYKYIFRNTPKQTYLF